MRLGADPAELLPRGVMVLSVVEALDFDHKQKTDESRQAVDEETGLPIWQLTGLDMRGLDPEERSRAQSTDPAERSGAFRGSPEVKVRILSETAPQVPQDHAAGMGAIVELVGLMVTPYLNTDRCNGHNPRCRAEIKYSYRATGVRPFRRA